MTTKQADKLVGREIYVSFPKYREEAVLTITSRRRGKSTVEAVLQSGHKGVFDCRDMELISIRDCEEPCEVREIGTPIHPLNRIN